MRSRMPMRVHSLPARATPTLAQPGELAQLGTGRGDQLHVSDAGRTQRLGRGAQCGTRGDHVVDDEHGEPGTWA